MNTLRILSLALLLVSFVACSKPLVPPTQEKLDMVHEKMSSREVKNILGEPTDSKTEPIPVVGGTKTTYIYTNKDGDRVVIVLKNDTVQSKEGHFSSK